MDTSRKSTLTLAFLLAFFIISSGYKSYSISIICFTTQSHDPNLYNHCNFSLKLFVTYDIVLTYLHADLIMNSEAELLDYPLARCNKDADCKKYCPKCVACNCLSGTCICTRPPSADNIPPF